MDMFIKFNKIQRYFSENGRLPSDLNEVGERPDGVRYVPLTGGAFKLSGKGGEITVDYTSTQPVAYLLADAIQIVSRGVPSTPGGAPPT